jgi:hypothetical protein
MPNRSSTSDGGSGLIRFPTSVNTDHSADEPLIGGYYSEPPSPIAEAVTPRSHATTPGDANGGGGGSGSGDSLAKRAAAAWRRLVHGPPRQPRYRSGYLTLIPLSDARLNPRRPRVIIGLALALALLIASGVFVAVPRGVSIGTLDMHSIRMHFNASTMVRARWDWATDGALDGWFWIWAKYVGSSWRSPL